MASAASLALELMGALEQTNSNLSLEQSGAK